MWLGTQTFSAVLTGKLYHIMMSLHLSGLSYFFPAKWDQVVQPIFLGGYKNVKSFIGLSISVGMST